MSVIQNSIAEASSFAQEMSVVPLRHLKSDVQSNFCHHLNYSLSLAMVVDVGSDGRNRLLQARAGTLRLIVIWSLCREPSLWHTVSLFAQSLGQMPGTMLAAWSYFCLLIDLSYI